MQFSGEITPEVEEEFRNLYYKRHPGFIIAWAILGIAAIALGIFVLGRVERLDGIILVIIGIVLFISAFTLPRIYWHFWWKQFLSIFGRQLSCKVMPAGIQLAPNRPLTEWKYFIATKQTASIVLFYLNKAEAYPIHRSMASCDSDWLELTSLAKKNVH